MIARRLSLGVAAVALLVSASACTDGVAPDPATESIGLAFSLQSASGAADGENAALGEAFDVVDRYRVRVVDRISRVIYFEGEIMVTPGAPAHLLQVELPDEALGRLVDVTLVALQGTTELFRSEVELTVRGMAVGSAVSGAGQTTIAIRYTGPGLRGSVTDADGAGLGGVAVTLLRDGATVQETTTGTDGSYLLTDLAAGSYVVRPEAPAGMTSCPAERTVTMGAGDAQVAAFLFRAGGCVTRLLVLSGGDVDDTETAVALFNGLPDVTAERYFVVNETPSLSELRGYDVVLVFQNGLFQESETLGGELVSFASLGGNLVFGSFFWQGRSDGGAGAKGWGPLEALDPFESAGGDGYTPGALGTVSAHPLTEGVTTLTSTGHRGGASAQAATTVVAAWDDGQPLVGYQTGSAGQRYVSVSLFPAHSHSGYCCVTGDYVALWQNAVRWAGLAGGPAGDAVLAGGR